MKYEVQYGKKIFEFESDKKSGQIEDVISGKKQTIPIFIAANIVEGISDDKDIKKKVDDALLETNLAKPNGEKGIKILDDKEKTNPKDKKNSDKSSEKKLYFVELKILGWNGDSKTGFNPGQWRAIGVLDECSKGFSDDGKETLGAIYLFEELSGKKDKNSETQEMVKKLKELYKGDVAKDKKEKKSEITPDEEERKPKKAVKNARGSALKNKDKSHE